MNSGLNTLDQAKGTLIDLAIRFGPKVLTAILIQNFGKIRQSGVSVGIAYEADLRASLEVIRDVVKANGRVLADPAPVVQADSAIQICMKPWVAVGDYGVIVGELNLAVVEELRRRGIGIPYPQREVRMLSAA